jgi:hypothetical protein
MTDGHTGDGGDGADRPESGGDDGITRRSILAGLGTVGAGSALAAGAAGIAFGGDEEAGGTDFGNGNRPPVSTAGGAFGGFTDVESFGSAGLSYNLVQSGELDLSACWERPGEDCTPTNDEVSIDFGDLTVGDSGSATLRCSVAGTPGWVWLRTNCPEDTCGLDRALRVTLFYDQDCDGDRATDGSATVVEVDGEPIERTRLCDALSALRGGALLDADPGGDPTPFSPDDACCIGLEWEVVDVVCEGDEDLEVGFELHAEQRRHNPDPEPPFDGGDCDVVCDYDCPPCDFQGISFVAFCIEDGELDPGDVAFTPFFDVDGEAYRVDWNSAVPIDWVVLFYGGVFENFRYDGATVGSVTVNSPENTPGNDAYDSTLVWKRGQDVTAYGQCPPDPCPNLSTDLYGPGVPPEEFGCGVKYEFDDRRWEPVCNDPCPGER